MQTQRDHVQAYRFSAARLATALVSGTPGEGQGPLHRSNTGVAIGLVIAALLSAAFAVYGLISPGATTSWQSAGTIVVEKETGNRYLFVGGTLYPTLNTASALLYYPDGTGHMVDVSHDSLAGVRHGHQVGIPGAPDSIPTGTALLPGAWSLCAGATGGMTINLDPAVRATPVPAGRPILVAAPGGPDHVVLHGTAYPVGSRGALLALGLGDTAPIPVTATWLHALAPGTPIAAPVIAGAGRPGPSIGGQPTTIGQLLSMPASSGSQYYVLRRDGVAPINRTELALLSMRPGATVRPVTPAELAATPVSSTVDSMPDLVDMPTYRPAAALCVRQDSVAAGSVVTENVPIPAKGTALNIPPGRGLYAYAAPLPSTGEPALSLITDQGVRFPLTEQAATALKLGATPVGVPAGVLAAMPAGPALTTGDSIMTADPSGGQ